MLPLALSSGHEIGLAVVAACFIAFALASSLLFPRFRVQFPGRGLPAFIAHGRADPVIGVTFALRARELLEAGGIEPEYHESDAAHHIDPAHVPAAIAWPGT